MNKKNVLLIGDSKSFMVSAVAKGLEEEHFNLMRIEPTMDAVSNHATHSKIWVMYLDGATVEKREELVYIKDQIIEHRIQFFLIGNPDELEAACRLIPAEFVREQFIRPLNVSILAAALEKEVAEEAKEAERKKILIIDDNPTTLRALQAQLEKQYRVFIASSGMNGIAFLLKQPVDLILLDYEMPVADGPQVLEMMKQESSLSSIPVMFLTGKSDKDSVLKAVSLKPVKYLLKTMAPQELLAEIDAFFHKKER